MTASAIAGSSRPFESSWRGLADSAATRPASKPQWLGDLRSHALERVGVLKLPSTRDEDWRFTDVSTLAKHPYQPVQVPTTLKAEEIAQFHLEEATTRLVFVDGKHAPHLSSTAAAEGERRGGQAAVGTLSSAIAAHGASIQAHLGRHAGFQDKLFVALNTAFLQDAAVVVAARNAQVTGPVHLLFISTQSDVVSHPRILVLAEPGSSVTLVEDHVTLHQGPCFNNPVAEIVLGASARVEHVRVQRDSAEALHVGHCAVMLGHASHYHSVSIALGARISRLGIDVVHGAEGAFCALDGLALLSARQLADTHSCIDHAKPHGTSRQLHKTIVDSGAHAVFNGKVRVAPGAQQTDSAQSSRNLLLSTRAQVNTLPQLEILADDVKCTHGATVGQLDSEQIFYLRSRGIAEAAARKLLTYAFGAEVIDRISLPSLRRQLELAVLDRTAVAPAGREAAASLRAERKPTRPDATGGLA
ncbi:MAG: Fe-S cluster assembly protein SufD [Burkholderiaceae bacterium]